MVWKPLRTWIEDHSSIHLFSPLWHNAMESAGLCNAAKADSAAWNLFAIEAIAHLLRLFTYVIGDFPYITRGPWGTRPGRDNRTVFVNWLSTVLFLSLNLAPDGSLALQDSRSRTKHVLDWGNLQRGMCFLKSTKLVFNHCSLLGCFKYSLFCLTWDDCFGWLCDIFRTC